MKRPGWRADRPRQAAVQDPGGSRAAPPPDGIARLAFAAVTSRSPPRWSPARRSVADPRWSPSGNRLAWVDSFDGRSDLVVAARRRLGARRWSSPPTCGARRRLVLGRRRRARRRRRRRPARRRRRRRRPASGCCTRDGRRVRARRLGAGRGRVRDRARRRVRRRDRAARRIGVAGARLARRLRVGSGVVARRVDARVARVGPPRTCRGTRRASCVRDGRRRACESIAGGDAVAAASRGSRPTARGSRSSPTPTAGRCCGSPTLPIGDGVRTRARCSPSARARRAGVGSPGNVRSRGRPTATELAWCRNEDGFGRLVIGAPGSRSARELSKGWHRGARLERARASRACGRAR